MKLLLVFVRRWIMRGVKGVVGRISIWGGLALGAGAAGAQEVPLDSLLRAHAYAISIQDHRVGGEGLEFLLDATRNAQFVAIAEEHNVKELNQFAEALFSELNRVHGYQYLVLEQGGIVTSSLGSGEMRGNQGGIADFAGRYPYAATFATDEEFSLMAKVGAISSSTTSPIWGVDQEFGALHILDRLAELAPTPEARQRIEELSVAAREHELDRSGEFHYVSMIAVPKDFETLQALFASSQDDEALKLIQALQRTVQIYHYLAMAREGSATGFVNGRVREESMRTRFMERYRAAQEAGNPLPKALVKMGHWHIYPGFFRSNVPTFGNFLSEFARSNGRRTFVISTYVVDGPEDWRNTRSSVADGAGEETFTLVDFRPLRALAHQNNILGLSDGLKETIFRVDAALLIRGGSTGSYEFVRALKGG